MAEFSLSRRAALAGAACLPLAPLAAAAAPARTPISELWAKAESLRPGLAAHRGDAGGIPAWMRTGGDVNRLGHERRNALVAILNETPRAPSDLALMARASLDAEMLNGPRGWAAERLAAATIAWHAGGTA